MSLLSQAAADATSIMESLPIGTLTPGVLLGLAVWLLLTGRIVPRKTLEDHLEEITFLRSAIENLQAVKLELAKQNTKLLGDKDLSVQILQSRRTDVADDTVTAANGRGGQST
jgi:hypothetical protein